MSGAQICFTCVIWYGIGSHLRVLSAGFPANKTPTGTA